MHNYICDFCQKEAQVVKRGTSIRTFENDFISNWNGRDTFYCEYHKPIIKKNSDKSKICDLCRYIANFIELGISYKQNGNGKLEKLLNKRDRYFCHFHVPQIVQVEDYSICSISYE